MALTWAGTQACELTREHYRAKAERGWPPDELSTQKGMALLDDVRGFGDGQLVVLPGLRDDRRPASERAVVWGRS